MLDLSLNLEYSTKRVMKLNNNTIKNGPLYFNNVKGQTTRVIGSLNSRRVWTQRRGETPEATSISDLRYASGEEVSAYLDKTEQVAALA